MKKRGEHTSVGGARPDEKMGRQPGPWAVNRLKRNYSSWKGGARTVLKRAMTKKRRQRDRHEIEA